MGMQITQIALTVASADESEMERTVFISGRFTVDKVSQTWDCENHGLAAIDRLLTG